MPSCAGGPNGKPKMKMKIKPFAKPPSLPPTFEADTWAKLSASVLAIQSKQSLPNISREELYRSCEDLCVHKLGANLYKNLREKIEEHICGTVNKLASDTANNTDINFLLSSTKAVWDDHNDTMTSIRSIFLYLDRSYVMQNSACVSIWDMGIELFRKHFVSVSLADRTVEGILKIIESQRVGQGVDKDILRALLRMLSSLGLYTEQFEPLFLAHTKAFFRTEGEKLIGPGGLNVQEFLGQVDRRLTEAAEQIMSYLEPSTRGPLVTAIESNFFNPHTHTLLTKGFDELMDNSRILDLKLLSNLMSRVEKVEELKDSLHQYTQLKAQGIIEGEDPKNVVDKLLDLREALDTVHLEAFNAFEPFKLAMKSAFEIAVNSKGSAPAELLAKYVDSKLRAGTKDGGKGGLTTEQVLDRIMVIFRYISSKDVFEVFYKNMLAKRLLQRKSASMDLEKSFISSLKAECGSNFTSKIEGMFKDMDLSDEITSNYSEYVKDKHASETASQRTKMELWVLTTGYWPSFPRMTNLILPDEIKIHQKRFESYYDTKYQGRRIEWQHSLSSCILDFNISKGKKKQLDVSQLQALVLLTFNGTEEGLTKTDIQEKTGIESDELLLVLQSLSLGKQSKEQGVTTRVLTKSTKDREVSDSDTFVVNRKFYHKLQKVKIPTLSNKSDVAEEEAKAHESVFRDRQHQIDAAVIRIMKTRKTLQHSALIAEVVKQLRWKAEMVDIKKRIESLIEREYLERAGGSTYNYLA